MCTGEAWAQRLLNFQERGVVVPNLMVCNFKVWLLLLNRLVMGGGMMMDKCYRITVIQESHDQ